ncbi:MAG: hypothetical protein JWL91_1929 [Sphingomonas bacterium]|nr:hypothetical protein [Sphingomonas bacterium]MDB5690053.1 hypothetical protein [Sphingomonas bacterium]
MKSRNILLAATAAWLAVGLTSVSAQQAAAPAARASASAPQDLTVLPPVPTNYTPKKTAWGDPDLRGTWPIDHLGGLPMQRTEAQGNRVFLNEQEFAEREARMEKSRNAAETETKANKLGMGNWVEMTGAGRRTSLLVAPANGRLPEMTAEGKARMAAGRSSWVKGQTYDWVNDFDSWDRCISRGFPASMLPFRYNNGIRIYQAPGYVVIDLEMIHDSRIIPLDNRPMPPSQVKSWMGASRGHWEGNTLVIETGNIQSGASPINMATIAGIPNNTAEMSDQAKVVERLTMTGPDAIVYEMTYSDPVMWTAPWTVRLDWQRNEGYKFFEYACHEGNVQVRNYINASRAEREKARSAATATPAAAAAKPKTAKN